MKSLAPDTNLDSALLRRWVDTWVQTGPLLEAIRRAEIESVDTQTAIRQIFGDADWAFTPGPPTSGLIEQQAYFARCRRQDEHAL